MSDNQLGQLGSGKDIESGKLERCEEKRRE